MAVSVGVRISGLLIAGALAIGTAAACGGGGDDAAGGSGGGGSKVSGGVADGGQGDEGTSTTGGTGGGTPTWRPPDDGSGGGGSSGVNGSSGSGSSSGTGGSGTDGGSGSRSGSGGGGDGGGGGGGGRIEGPSWLPLGPKSPNTDTEADPASVYDLLAEHPEKCGAGDTAGLIPTNPSTDEWRVVRALAEVCKAVQGQNGSWDTAAADYAALRGRLTGCKGRAAYAALGGVLRFHQQHPSATARLPASSGNGSGVCAFRIASVDVGGDDEAKPGETITITVDGIYFDKQELLRGGSSVTIADRLAFSFPEEPDYGAEPPDRLTFTVAIPEPWTGSLPRSASVSIKHANEKTVTLDDAFTLVAADTVGSPGPSPIESLTNTPSITPAP